MLKVTFFGVPQIHHNYNALTGAVNGRCLALFAYLALSEQPQARSHLADLLSFEIGEQQARQNLRYVLYDLRKLLGDYLIVTRETVAFAHHKPCWVDANIFTKYLTLDTTVDNPTLLQGVLQLYQGELLTGFAIQNAPDFDGWLSQQRRQFHNQAVQTLLLLSERLLSDGDYAGGLTATRRLLQLEPWHEAAHRLQMRLLAYSGQRLTAINHYEICRQMLQTELGIEPEATTTQLLRAIETGVLTPPAAPVSKPKPLAVQVNWDAVPAGIGIGGRDDELAQLHHWLADPQRQVIGLFGLAGLGKSALAAELMARLVEGTTATEEARPDACAVILWSTLTTFPTLAHLLQEWLSRLTQTTDPQLNQLLPPPPLLAGEPLAAVETLLQQLLIQLRRRRVLLVVDEGEALYGRCGALIHYQPGWEAFDELLRRLADNEHCSCLLFLSRITPLSWEPLARRCSTVRTLTLAGLTMAASVALLRTSGDCPPALLQALAAQSAGHPQTLVAMRDLLAAFGSDLLVTALQEPYLVSAFGQILADHFVRLTSLEQTLLSHLACLSTPPTVATLWQQISHTGTLFTYLEALQSLQRHHWLLPSRPGAALFLPPLVKRFMEQQISASAENRVRMSLPLSPETAIQYRLQQSIAASKVAATKSDYDDPMPTKLRLLK